ncbi:MAG: glycosyltransferase family 39 protein [Nanoarchaeota archaeon]
MELYKKILLISLFIIFLFLRIFVDSPSILLAADSLKFLSLAKNFPYHTLSNNQLYLLHAPFYPYTIHFANLLIKEDYLAAIALNLIAACVTFFVIYRFLMMLTNNFKTTFITLLFVTLSVDLIIASHKVTRESFVIMMLVSAIYFYAKGVKYEDKKSLVYASIIGGILGVTTDHAIFLFPSFGLSYLILNSKKISFKKFDFPNLKYAILPVAVTFLFYASWIGIRAYQYSTHEYYPTGYEGAPLRTESFGLFELINPSNFEDFDTREITGIGFIPRVKNYLYVLGYIFNIELFSIPIGLNFTTMKYLLSLKHIFYMFIIYLPLAIIVTRGFFSILKNFKKTRKIYNNIDLYMLSLFLIFVSPITQQTISQRHVYPAYTFFFYIMACGLINLFKKIDAVKKYTKLSFVTLVMLTLLLIPWYYNHNNFIFQLKKVVSSQNTVDFVNKHIEKTAAIMAQPGYTYKLIYMTGNRAISMPSSAKDLLPFVEYYNISYVMFGRYYTLDKYQHSTDSIQIIKDRPDKFRLVATINEDYTKYINPKDPASTDEVYIYEVKK